MKAANEISIANWVSRILRWALGIIFVWMAYSFEDAEVLYFLGAVVFATGFLKPKRCTDGSCNI